MYLQNHIQHNTDFDKLVKIYSKFGENYPTAISKAIKDLTNESIKTPNDLLGVSYLKTILKNNYNIVPETIKRTNNYHDEDINGTISAATAIRKALKENEDISNQVPKYSIVYLNNLHYIDDYFPYLKYKIITENDLSIYNMIIGGHT